MEVVGWGYIAVSGDLRNFMSIVSKLIYFACFALALLVATTCLRIEILNAQLGYYMPRENDADWGISRWRKSTAIDEKAWIRMQSRFDSSIENRPLTSQEQEEMRNYIKWAKANNDLRDLVEGLGLLQYLLIPILIVISVILIKRNNPKTYRILAFMSMLLGLISGFLVFYRGYFESLGW